VTTPLERAVRSERLHVRLTTAEAAHVAHAARARGLSVSDYVRVVALRGGGFRALAGRRALATEASGTIRQLAAIAADLRRLIELVQVGATVRQDELDACLARMQVALETFGP
jgi:hypothetical protein